MRYEKYIHNHNILRKDARGFTLVELMFVVAIVGLMAAMGTSSYRRAVDSGRVENYSKGIARVINQARMNALLKGEQTVFMIKGQYAIAATGADANNDGQLAWVDANGNGLPDPNQSLGFKEGELERVIDFTAVRESTISLVTGAMLNGYQTGCMLLVGGANCTVASQILFRQDGLVYEALAMKNVPIFNPATFTLAVQRNLSGSVAKNEFALLMVGAGGLVERYSPQ